MIYDIDDNPIAGFNYPMSSGQVVPFQIRADCQAGLRLFSDVVGDLTVEGRLAGVGSYVNLETSDISLGAYAGTRQNFDIRITAGTVVTLVRRTFKIKVAY